MTQATPPVMTLTGALKAAATSPASTSPSFGPPVTTMKNTAPSRPRRWSGTVTCRIVERKIALTTSAAPASARKTSAAIRFAPARPNPAIAAPHATTAHTTARP